MVPDRGGTIAFLPAQFDAVAIAAEILIRRPRSQTEEIPMSATSSETVAHDDSIRNPAPQDLMARIADARQRTDDLFAIVKPESLYDRPIAERHRIIFYIGHLEAFDWNLFHERVFGVKSFHPEFDRLFAFGIDPVGGGLPNDQPSDWPSLSAVRDYVRTIRSTLDCQTPRSSRRFRSSRRRWISAEHLLECRHRASPDAR